MKTLQHINLKFIRLFTVFMLLLFSYPVVIGQKVETKECAFVLKEAQKLYQLGNIEELPSLLSSCLKDGFTKEEQLEGYKLIIMCYLFNDDLYKADSAMLQFLKKYPDYELTITDSKKFSSLFHSYRTSPILAFGIVGGLNTTFNQVIEHYSVNNLNASASKYKKLPGYQVGLRLKKNIYEKYDILADIQLTQNGYVKQESTSFADGEVESASLEEQFTSLYMPLSLVYNFNPIQKFTPYVKLGAGVSYLFSAGASAENSTIQQSSGELDVLDVYKPYKVWINTGAGVGFDFLRGNVIFDISYSYSVNSQLNTVDDIENELLYKFGQMPDLLRQGILQFSVGYIYSVYKPRKLK